MYVITDILVFFAINRICFTFFPNKEKNLAKALSLGANKVKVPKITKFYNFQKR